MSGATDPLTRAQAEAIARPFRPGHPLGNRYDYYYTRTKLRTDPLYPGVLAQLRGSSRPLLDLGCGLGLLAHALHADGQRQPYLGVDVDAAKVSRAVTIAERGHLTGVRFEVRDLGLDTLPDHCGDVAILDVLQYLPEHQQASLLQQAADRLAPEGLLVIRAGLDDSSGRSHTSRTMDFLAHFAGWMKTRPRSFPTRERLQADLARAALCAEFSPLYGHTPFNNWLIVATRG